MSLALVPARPADPHDPPGVSRHTSLIDFPKDATLRRLRKPTSGAKPIDNGQAHVSEIIPGDGNIVLICFASTATDDWDAIKREITTAKAAGLTPMVVASVDADQLACALYGAIDRVYVPSLTLRRILGIDRTSYGTCNGLVLIRDGQVSMTWTPKDDGYDSRRFIKPFDWTSILSLIG